MVNCVTRLGGLWLKLIMISILCSVSIESVVQAQDSGLSTPSPDIFFPETKHTFGKVFVGEKAEHVFKFVNRGNAVLDINELSTGCNCTVANLQTWHTEPGKEGEIKVTFSPDESTRIGKTAKFVYVDSNDPDSPRFKLKFTANVRKDVIYTPAKFELGLVPKGNTGTKRLIFESKLNPAGFNITKVTTFNPSVGVSYGKLNDKGEWYVEAFMKDDAVPKKLAGNITVFTNSVKQPEIKISTLAEVVKEITAVPEKICFGKVTKGKEVVRSLTILHAKDVKIEKIEPSLSWISANITPADNTNDSSIEVKLKLSSANAPKGKSEGSLSVYTNSQKHPVLKVHLCANVLEPQI